MNNAVISPAPWPRRRDRDPVRDPLRQTILDAAGRILVAEGLEGLSMRRLARTAGCSTMALYTAFGGKEGVVNELYRDGLERLYRALDAVHPPGDPVAYVLALGWAYRAYALANPTAYAVMFARAISAFIPAAFGRHTGARGFEVLVRAVEGGIAAGSFIEGQPTALADALWGVVHGMVSLELAGYLGDEHSARQRYELAMRMAVDGLVARPACADNEES